MPERVVRGIEIVDGVAKEVDFVFEDDPHRGPRFLPTEKVAHAVEDVHLGPVRQLCKRLVHRLREYLS